MTDGRVVAGHAVRLACRRHLTDLTTLKGYRFDAALAQHAIDFFPRFLRLAEGEHAGQPFVLQPWQQFIVGSLFGWLGTDGFRRFRTGYIEAAKGCGKTPMLAGIGLYGILFDDEPGAHVYIGAVTREQAGIMFQDCKNMVQAAPELAARLDVLEHNIAHLPSGSFIRPVSSEGKSLDAKRVHMGLIDEVHEHLRPVVVDKLRAGTKGRRNGLILEITNSGFDRTSVCWAHHVYSLRVLEKLDANPSWFAYVCQLDPCAACRTAGRQQPSEECAHCDDWRDEKTWPKANPNIGVSISLKYLREQVQEAIGIPSKQNLVKRLNFCLWTETFSRWLDMEHWAACADAVPDEALLGVPCYAGLDLGMIDDQSAFARMWVLPDGRLVVRMRFWIPKSALTRFPDRPYHQWRASGDLVVTEGESTDYAQVQSEVLELCRASSVRELAYDKQYAQQMAQWLEGQGLVCVDTRQGYMLNEALRAFAKSVIDRTLCHGGDPILAWHASNAVVRHGTRGEIRLDKEEAGDKIDGIAACAMAMDRVIRQVESAVGITVLG